MKRRAILVAAAVVAVLAGASAVRASLILLKPAANTPATFVGRGGVSSDGLGQLAPGGSLQAQVPAGSKVEHAYLYGAYAVRGRPPAADLTVNFDGRNVALTTLATIREFLTSARADVTAQVAAKVRSGGATTSFAVGNDPASLDGLALVVVYSNPRLPTTTVAVLDGAAEVTGDTATFSFESPVDPGRSGFAASLAIGSGHSYQGEAGPACGTYRPAAPALPQSSTIEVNGTRISSCAGNYDDGAARDGALITVGGVGDAIDNPSNPNQKPGDGSAPRTSDDELYDLRPFLAKGTTQLTIRTANESRDDLVFLAIISVTGEAGVTTGKPPPPQAGTSFNADVRSGVITCRTSASGSFTPLTDEAQFRVGSECDATKGRMWIRTQYGGEIETMEIFAGRFRLIQSHGARAIPTLVLTGGDFAVCKKKTRAISSRAAKRRPVRRVWGRGKGHYRTTGRYSSSTVRGTYWLTEDACEGTFTRVREGVVEVRDVRKRKTIRLRAGQSYLAAPPARR